MLCNNFGRCPYILLIIINTYHFGVEAKMQIPVFNCVRSETYTQLLQLVNQMLCNNFGRWWFVNCQDSVDYENFVFFSSPAGIFFPWEILGAFLWGKPNVATVALLSLEFKRCWQIYLNMLWLEPATSQFVFWCITAWPCQMHHLAMLPSELMFCRYLTVKCLPPGCSC